MSGKVLLIGGEGYIGKVVSNFLLKKNMNIISYDNLIYYENKNEYINKNKISYLEYGDLSNLDKMTNILDHIDYVVVLAGLVGDPITKKYESLSKIINEDNIINFVNRFAFKNFKKFIFISTCSNYGLINEDQIADENFELKPLSLYSKSKVKIENYLINNNFNFQPTILRFATAFGLSERMRFDLTVNEFTADLFLKKSIDVYDQDTWRPYCHVKDFARLIYMIIESDISKVGNQVFNAGTNINNASKKDIVKIIQKKIPNTKVNYVKNGTDKRNYKVDFSKIKNELNYQPNYSIEDGIDEIIQAFKNGLYADYLKNKLKYGNYKVYTK